jgi:hypothetical protein
VQLYHRDLRLGLGKCGGPTHVAGRSTTSHVGPTPRNISGDVVEGALRFAEFIFGRCGMALMRPDCLAAAHHRRAAQR